MKTIIVLILAMAGPAFGDCPQDTAEKRWRMCYQSINWGTTCTNAISICKASELMDHFNTGSAEARGFNPGGKLTIVLPVWVEEWWEPVGFTANWQRYPLVEYQLEF